MSTSFEALNLHPELLRAVTAAGFEQPTPIQQKAIPPAAAGRDLLACAMTGSGKTAAFMLPILQRLREKPRRKTQVLILTPTRELAAQIVEHGRELALFTGIRLEAIFGGVAFTPQDRALREGVEIIVACPGRLLDHFGRGVAFPDLEILVLDEADRMLDMGFLPDVKRVLQQIPKPAQSLLFSATLPGPIVELAGNLLKNPAMIDIDRQSKPSTQVDQAVFPVPEGLKRFLLAALLEKGVLDRVLVFTRTKHRADRLAQFLNKRGITADRIHANRSQNQRTRTLAAFKDGECRVLVATDIAARGIDVEALEHVVNFDVPNVPEDYVHRIGRTGRAEATGEAFTFVGPHEENDLRAIERTIARRLERRTLEGFDYQAVAEEKLEIPLADRLAAMRAARAGKKRPAAAPAERAARPVRPVRSVHGERQPVAEVGPQPFERPFGRGPEKLRDRDASLKDPRRDPSAMRDERGSGRPGQSRPGQSRPGQSRPGQSRPGQSRPVQGRVDQAAGPSRAGQSRPERPDFAGRSGGGGAWRGDDRGNRAPQGARGRFQGGDDDRGNRLSPADRRPAQLDDDRGNRAPRPGERPHYETPFRENRAADRFPESRGAYANSFRHAGDDARRREQIEEGRRRQAMERDEEGSPRELSRTRAGETRHEVRRPPQTDAPRRADSMKPRHRTRVGPPKAN